VLLHCTLVRGPGAATGIPADPVELSVELPRGCPGTELAAAMARQYGTTGLTVAGVPLRTLAAGEAPLVSGAVLVDGAASGPARDDGAALLLAVLSGPGAGTLLPLRRGSYRVGRGGTDLVLPDPDLSRAHALLKVTDTGVTLVDLGSANGTTVDGKPVASVRVSSDSVIGCGPGGRRRQRPGPTPRRGPAAPMPAVTPRNRCGSRIRVPPAAARPWC